jgi:hypothetical protein
MSKQLTLSSSDYQWLLTIFYIAYIVFEWFTFMWKLVPPHIWATFCVMGWGITAMIQSATYSFKGMMAARFFLGLFEALPSEIPNRASSCLLISHILGFQKRGYLSRSW